MAVEAFAYLAQFYRNQRLLMEAPPPLAHREPPDLAGARALVSRALAAGRTVLGATESKDFLAAFRIPVARSFDAPTEEQAVRAADECGYPVVLKIRSPDITHKSDVGGVRLGIPDAPGVRRAFAEMIAAAARARPEARIEGVSVERMVSSAHGRELMAGITTDEVFGPAITFGAGGIAVEVLRDRAVALPPLNARLADSMIAGTRVGLMLGAFRHLPAVDRAALDEVLLRVSEIACEIPEVAELDVNPLIADEHGVLALDARVALRACRPGMRRHAHLAIQPYPSELEAAETLADGSVLQVRPIRPEDSQLEEAFVSGLSQESRRLRFQSALRHLSPAMLARFTQIDYDREMALVAIEGAPGAEREVAVCRYVSLPDARSCEFAIVVADPWQRRGLGRRLMLRLIAIARDRGLVRMEGWVLAGNAPMLRMCAELGFTDHAVPGDPATRRVSLDF